MLVTLPNQFKTAINKMPFNVTVKKNAIKIYAALYSKSHLKNSTGFFPVPSAYLAAVNKRYYKILDYFVERGLIDYYKKAYTDDKDIFNTIYRKSYNKELGICAKYRFLVNVEVGDEVNVDMVSNRTNRWWNITENSLIEAGFDVKISRDDFGRRVWHSAIRNYKTDFQGYYTIDSQCSQPRLLYKYFKDKGINDPEYMRIFNNELDFYSEVAKKLDFTGTKESKRADAKDLFMHWINGNGYVPDFEIHNLFPIASKYLKSIKKGNYKSGGSLLQRIESKIWIDDLLTNIPCDFALPVHDSVIVKEKDVDRVLEYCKAKYPEIRFKKALLK
ncbi:hypothetical protein FPZ42_07765 [Mucilaginibacter achroorhodeus]|uniref:DNA-directed DNA polymerase family A palm domain-containing protein n=1 Tax=Mucilaginibacter achroorhodeus TaxID=2599294 RepID=A0A563U6G9_9SPHI|nr:hypothetical protein [Mucilaginibacter achroorhodeus]TWR26923.1 hypothetical protein FPZ42_07765 [Mucilaginibacter achroorhodeus]